MVQEAYTLYQFDINIMFNEANRDEQMLSTRFLVGKL